MLQGHSSALPAALRKPSGESENAAAEGLSSNGIDRLLSKRPKLHLLISFTALSLCHIQLASHPPPKRSIGPLSWSRARLCSRCEAESKRLHSSATLVQLLSFLLFAAMFPPLPPRLGRKRRHQLRVMSGLNPRRVPAPLPSPLHPDCFQPLDMNGWVCSVPLSLLLRILAVHHTPPSMGRAGCMHMHHVPCDAWNSRRIRRQRR